MFQALLYRLGLGLGFRVYAFKPYLSLFLFSYLKLCNIRLTLSNSNSFHTKLTSYLRDLSKSHKERESLSCSLFHVAMARLFILSEALKILFLSFIWLLSSLATFAV